MRVEEKIVRLCDEWWTEQSHSKSATIRPQAERWLECLGWTRVQPVYLEHAACGFVGLGKDNKRIVFYFTMPGELETPSAVLERGLDYCETTLMLVGEAQLEGYEYAVITDLNRTYVYDATTDGLILSSDSPQLFVSDVLDFLLNDAVIEGALEDARREPASYIARQLRSWCKRWTRELSCEPFGSEDIADAVIDRVLLLRFLYNHPICEAPNWSYKSRFTHAISSAYEESTVTSKRILSELMNDLATMWGFDFFTVDPAVERFISKSTVMVNMMQEIALLAKIKFTPSTILESFNYGDASEKARVRLVPEANEEREEWLGRLSAPELGKSRMEIDVLDEGYRAIPYWLDRLVKTVNRLNATESFRQRFHEYSRRTPVPKEGDELDLFDWSEGDSTPSSKSDDDHLDLLALCAERSLHIWTASERQHRCARITLYLYLIEQYSQEGNLFGRFPQIEPCFGNRPAMLESDKQWIYKGNADGGSEWDAM